MRKKALAHPRMAGQRIKWSYNQWYNGNSSILGRVLTPIAFIKLLPFEWNGKSTVNWTVSGKTFHDRKVPGYTNVKMYDLDNVKRRANLDRSSGWWFPFYVTMRLEKFNSNRNPHPPILRYKVNLRKISHLTHFIKISEIKLHLDIILNFWKKLWNYSGLFRCGMCVWLLYLFQGGFLVFLGRPLQI